jgi:hypothetical protein
VLFDLEQFSDVVPFVHSHDAEQVVDQPQLAAIIFVAFHDVHHDCPTILAISAHAMQLLFTGAQVG